MSEKFVGNDILCDFATWLREEIGLTAFTAEQYTSLVNPMLARGAKKDLGEALAQMSPSTRRNARSSWNYFRKWRPDGEAASPSGSHPCRWPGCDEPTYTFACPRHEVRLAFLHLKAVRGKDCRRTGCLREDVVWDGLCRAHFKEAVCGWPSL
jgi:hypothetical protein